MKCSVRGYSSEGFGGRFIKWFTFGNISHVSIVIDSGHGALEFEALQGKGVIRHEPHSPKDKEFTEYEVPLDEWQILDAYCFALTTASCDTKYDWSGIWGFMIRRDKHSPYKYFCSELVAYILHKVGYPLSRREPYRETPTSVCESLRLIAPVVEAGNA